MKKELPLFCKILVVTPHPDDEVIWSGAILKKLAKNNEVFVAFVKKTQAERKNEALKANQFLKTKPLFLDLSLSQLKQVAKNPTFLKSITNLLLVTNPTIIFLPYQNDIHPTHKLVHKIFKKAILNLGGQTGIKEIWQYDGWSLIEKPNFIYCFDQQEMEEKLKALSFYKSQIKRMPYQDLVLGLALLRGAGSSEILNGFGSTLKPTQKYGEAFWRKSL